MNRNMFKPALLVYTYKFCRLNNTYLPVIYANSPEAADLLVLREMIPNPLTLDSEITIEPSLLTFSTNATLP